MYKRFRIQLRRAWRSIVRFRDYMRARVMPDEHRARHYILWYLRQRFLNQNPQVTDFPPTAAQVAQATGLPVRLIRREALYLNAIGEIFTTSGRFYTLMEMGQHAYLRRTHINEGAAEAKTRNAQRVQNIFALSTLFATITLGYLTIKTDTANDNRIEGLEERLKQVEVITRPLPEQLKSLSPQLPQPAQWSQ